MSFVNKILEKILPNNKDVKPGDAFKPPLLSETIVRSESYKDNYNGWLQSKAYVPAITLIRNAYEFKKIGTDFHINLHIFQSKQSNGFYFSFHESFGKKEFTFLFDYFKDKILKQDYYLYTSKREINERPNHIQELEMHYLKPNRTTEGDKANQEFGNIVIEHVKIDDEASYIKLMANVYSDSLYENPKDFEDLIGFLFSTSKEHNS